MGNSESPFTRSVAAVAPKAVQRAHERTTNPDEKVSITGKQPVKAVHSGDVSSSTVNPEVWRTALLIAERVIGETASKDDILRLATRLIVVEGETTVSVYNSPEQAKKARDGM